MEHNVLEHFTNILQEESNRRGGVALQVLQSLAILCQNIASQQTIYCLFSNDHINKIISLEYDFEDDEVLGYYINLLKTISLKLDRATIQFFYRGVEQKDVFPLYTESIKLSRHKDGMVRAAVRTITLNIYAVDVPEVHTFIAQHPNSFSSVVEQLKAESERLDESLSEGIKDLNSIGVLESRLAELEDLISYCSDILSAGIAGIDTALLSRLWSEFLDPVVFDALTMEPSNNGTIVGPLCALYVLERLIQVFSVPRELERIVLLLLGTHRATLLTFLDGKDVQLAAATVRVLAALTLNTHIAADTLLSVGLMLGDRDVPPLCVEIKQHQETNIVELRIDENPTVVKKMEMKVALLKFINTQYQAPLALGIAGWMLKDCHIERDVLSMVDEAVANGQAAIKVALGQSWCDALPPMLAAEWSRATPIILRGVGAASLHVAAQTWGQAAALQELLWEVGGDVDGVAAASTSVAARLAWLSAASAAVVFQTASLLRYRRIDSSNMYLGSIKIQELRANEPQQRTLVPLKSVGWGDDEQLWCTVAFSPGQEVRARIVVEGLPPHLVASEDGYEFAQLKPDSLHQLLTTSTPTVLIVHPSNSSNVKTRTSTGSVLSVAALMGVAPYVDDQHDKWLHVEVRPLLSSILKLLKASVPGTELVVLSKGLASGHWVLAFDSPEDARTVLSMLSDAVEAMRAVYKQALNQQLLQCV